MIAIDEDRPAAREFPSLAERVLTVCGVYGPNASGKTNLLDAVAWLSGAVRLSLRAWDTTVPRQPFRFGDGPTTPSTFEIEMMVGGVRYAYDLTLDSSAVLSETLVSYPERRPRTLLRRDGMKLHLRRGLGGLSGSRELLTPTTLALSAAMRFNTPEVRSFGAAVTGIGTIGRRIRRRTPHTDHLTPTAVLLRTGADSDRADALTLLRFADLGIDDVEFVEEPAEGLGDEAGTVVPMYRPRLVHRVADQQLPFELPEESEGTRTWFALIGPILDALRSGRTLLFDEIDASLHPRLSARLIELFQDPETNPRGAQLVFTSHDTSLLNHLNRDEVWLTEKNMNGSTVLTALAEYGGEKVRRSVNLEKAYLQGRFGAVPELDQAILRRALGLTAAGA